MRTGHQRRTISLYRVGPPHSKTLGSMNQGIPFWAVLLWVLVAVLPLAVFIFSLLVGLGGHSPRYFDVVSTTVLLVELVACIGFIWYLYIKLGFK